MGSVRRKSDWLHHATPATLRQTSVSCFVMDDNEISRKDIINDKHAMDGKVDYIKSDGHIKN